MRYSFLSAAVLAFTSVVYAQTANFDPITSPTQDQSVAAGSSLDITWQATSNYTGKTVTISLLEGSSPSTLSVGPVVAAGISNDLGKYTWSIPTTLGSFATYGFVITLDSDKNTFQYSFPFHITGLSASGSATGSGTATVTLHLSSGTPSSSAALSSSANVTSTISTAPQPTSNTTIVTSIKSGSSSPTKSSSPSGSSTGTPNAAGQIATGGLAMIGGLLIAFAL